MSDKPFDDGPPQRAVIMQRAVRSLETAAENMRRELGLAHTVDEIGDSIKATLNAPLPPYNFTVLQTLCERYRANVFNDIAAETFPEVREEFARAIRDLAIAQDESPRKARKLANNAWKWDPAADRRVREGSAEPYRGRPEIYDRDVVWALADAIVRCAGQKHFATGHHGDVTITEDDDKGGGPMFRALVAAVRWAMIVAWQMAAPPGTEPPTVKPEGILTVVKRAR